MLHGSSSFRSIFFIGTFLFGRRPMISSILKKKKNSKFLSICSAWIFIIDMINWSIGSSTVLESMNSVTVLNGPL